MSTSQSEDASRYESLLDPVTHLPGLVLLRDRLEVALAHARRVRRSIAVLSVDLRTVAPAGASRWNEALGEITERLQESIRVDDTVARTSEHEFVVVCNDILDPDDLDFIARCLEQALWPPTGDSVQLNGPPVVAGVLGRADSTASGLLDALAARRGTAARVRAAG